MTAIARSWSVLLRELAAGKERAEKAFTDSHQFTDMPLKHNLYWRKNMDNLLFGVEIFEKDGTITSLVCKKDRHAMNWCSGLEGWGKIRFFDGQQIIGGPIPFQTITGMQWMTPREISANENGSICVYEYAGIRVTVTRSFDENGYLNERYALKNLRDADLFLEQGDIGIALPYNDIYTYADDCMVNRCNTHLWCGGSTTYVNAVKMGESDINLGLILTDGAFASYSMCHADTYSQRGVFLLDCEHIELLSQEEYVWNWKLFWYKDEAEFMRITEKYRNMIRIEADHYTVFEGEPIRCRIRLNFEPENLSISWNGIALTPTKKNGQYEITYTPQQFGDNRLLVNADDVHTFAEFFVSEKPDEVIRKRLSFIAEKQQYKRKGSPLYGAYLIYDNEKKYPIFDSVVRDHNACRERMGMSLLMCSYLQEHEDEFLRASLNDFVTFMEREFYETETGKVYDGVGKNSNIIRLYNAPWVITFYTELYYLTGDKKYLTYCVKSLDLYYSGGGYRFYPNGFSMLRTCNAFRDAGMYAEYDHVVDHFRRHVDTIVSNGLSYPKHEVNYEQTIVTPAVTFISEFALISGEEKYAREAEKHVKALARFNGHQPSCHMNETPIRYWDDFFFGSERLQGDTFPHYWSCLTARSFIDYYHVSHDETYKKAAEECIRNCFCLFNEKGEGSCAYVYPYRCNDRKGEFYDKWANDQDFALYFYRTMFGVKGE